MAKKGYCLDTMSFINLIKRYPKRIAVFAPMWTKLEQMIDQSIILSPMESYFEIERGGDEVAEWAKTYKRQIFLEPDEKEIQSVKKVLFEHPNLHDKTKRRYDADPFIIAFAMNRELVAVTEERRTHIGGKKNIANVCLNYGIQTMNLVEFIEDLKIS